MSAQDIHARNLHHHTAAEADPRPRRLARECEAHIVEIPPLGTQGVHADQPLRTCRIETNECTEVGDPRDGSRVPLSNTTGVQLRNLHLLRGVRSRIGRSLVVARLSAELWANRLERLRTLARESRSASSPLLLPKLMLGEGDLENAMRNQIGVSANRTGEMAVRPMYVFL